jgi:co-chaperonin GroES (HSP10)
MKFKPNGSWVVLPDPTINETESGIILDETTAAANAARSNILQVIAIGKDCTFTKTGDTVMVDPRTEAIKTEIDGKKYLLVGEHQLLGKWKGKKHHSGEDGKPNAPEMPHKMRQKIKQMKQRG